MVPTEPTIKYFFCSSGLSYCPAGSLAAAWLGLFNPAGWIDSFYNLREKDSRAFLRRSPCKIKLPNPPKTNTLDVGHDILLSPYGFYHIVRAAL